MSTWLDKLNLQPQERRGVLIGLVLLALVFNYWFVWDYFGEWPKVNAALDKADAKCETFRKGIEHGKEYSKRLAELEKKGAAGVLEEDQANRVQSTITTEAFNHHVVLISNNVQPNGGATNSFFKTVTAKLEINAGEEDIIGFLYALGTGDSMIRVQDMINLGLDATQQKLKARMTLVASFQKKEVKPPVSAPKMAVAPAESAKSSPAAKNGTTIKNATTNSTKGTNAIATNRPAAVKLPTKKN